MFTQNPGLSSQIPYHKASEFQLLHRGKNVPDNSTCKDLSRALTYGAKTEDQRREKNLKQYSNNTRVSDKF